MGISPQRLKHTAKLIFICVLLLGPSNSWTQASRPTAPPPEAKPETPKDTLGRSTPRGTVVGFLNAARKGNAEIAALYLNTPLRGDDAHSLARQLGVVLDRRLPPRLSQISDEPEGSVPDPLKPDEDVIGTIVTANGDLDIVLERVDRGKSGKVWLFSKKTLDSIPSVFQEVNEPALEEFLPQFLVRTTVAYIPLFEWLALFVGLPLLFFAASMLSRGLGWGLGALQRRFKYRATLQNPKVLPIPARLVLIAIVIYFLLKNVALPLLARQFWSAAALMMAVVGCIWWLVYLNGVVERFLTLRRRGVSGSASVLRLFRRLVDGLIVFAGFLYILYHFGVNVTAAFAGLGVGGIAVALAAQKTLENVIAGVSLIADQAVRVGDFLSLGDVQGTIEDVGLRSTRIRTLDRTVVSLPNGQIANMKLETISLRDKFWFHPIIGLRYETMPAQLHSVLSGLRELLRTNPSVDWTSVRVRFIRLGSFSLDVEVFAYVSAADWAGFLEIQEQMLFSIIDIVHKAGASLAFPSQSLYLHADGTTSGRLLAPSENSRETTRVA